MSKPESTTKSYSVRAESRSPRRVDATARDVTVSIDSPPESGGGGAGPHPVEALLGALAGCLNSTGHTVAAGMDIDLRNERMTVEGALNPARLRGDETDDRAGFRTVRATMEIEADATDEAVAAWLAAHEARNPVLDDLRVPTDVEVSVAR